MTTKKSDKKEGDKKKAPKTQAPEKRVYRTTMSEMAYPMDVELSVKDVYGRPLNLGAHSLRELVPHEWRTKNGMMITSRKQTMVLPRKLAIHLANVMPKNFSVK